MSSVPKRSDIDEEYRWDLDSIYASGEEWGAAHEDVAERVPELASYEGCATEDPETFLELLEMTESVLREVPMVVSYANLRSSRDTRNREYQVQAGRAEALASKARSTVSYLDSELQELGRGGVTEFAEKEPELSTYEHYFDDVLWTKEHTRSTEVGEVLVGLSEVTGAPSDIYSMLANADLELPAVKEPNGTSVKTTQGNFIKLQKYPDRGFRRTAHEELYGRWADACSATGTLLENSAKKDVKTARIRDYETAREAALDDPNVPVEMYNDLLDTVRDNLGHLHRHVELKREVIGADELRMRDLYVSLTGDHGLEIPYEQVKEYIVEAVEPPGEVYQEWVTGGLNDRQVDMYENRGRRPEVYSAGIYDTQPFIMMNCQDDSASMFTLAHELDHSMHSEFVNDAQLRYDASYEIFTAGVASTVNETLPAEYLLENVDDDELWTHVLDGYLERFRSTLFRQTMFVDFEFQVHEIIESDGVFTPGRFDELYGDLKETYYEPATTDDRIAREQERIPHLYYDYYVYQYAAGISAVAAIVECICEEGEPAVADYHEALALGGSEYPLGMLRTAGADITEPEPIEDVMSVYAESLGEVVMLLDLE